MAITKKEVIELFKKNIKFYGIPTNMGRMSKLDLIDSYDEAVELGLLKESTEETTNKSWCMVIPFPTKEDAKVCQGILSKRGSWIGKVMEVAY